MHARTQTPTTMAITVKETTGRCSDEEKHAALYINIRKSQCDCTDEWRFNLFRLNVRIAEQYGSCGGIRGWVGFMIATGRTVSFDAFRQVSWKIRREKEL